MGKPVGKSRSEIARQDGISAGADDASLRPLSRADLERARLFLDMPQAAFANYPTARRLVEILVPEVQRLGAENARVSAENARVTIENRRLRAALERLAAKPSPSTRVTRGPNRGHRNVER